MAILYPPSSSILAGAMKVDLPDTYNAATTFVDDNIKRGSGGKVAIHYLEQKLAAKDEAVKGK